MRITTLLLALFLPFAALAQPVWEMQYPNPFGSHFYDVTFLNAQNGFTVGSNGTILQTTDGGATWTKKPTGINWKLNRITSTRQWLALP